MAVFAAANRFHQFNIALAAENGAAAVCNAKAKRQLKQLGRLHGLVLVFSLRRYAQAQSPAWRLPLLW